MMKKMFKKYKVSIITSAVIIIIGFIGIIYFTRNNLHEYQNDYYTVRYDDTWNLSLKNKNVVTLKHGKSRLNIEIIDLVDEARYSSIDELVDEVIYNLENQNKEFKLLSRKDTTFSENNYKGYKLLYESSDSQVMSSFYKKSDKLIIFNFLSSNKDFDMLLDSVQNIIYNFDTKETTYNLSNKLSLDTGNVSFLEDLELDKTLKKDKTYEVANNNYYVKYSIPECFRLSEFNSSLNYFNYKGNLDRSLNISVNIYNTNLYEYLDKDNSVSVYSTYNGYKEDKDYSNFSESLVKLDRDIDTYMYKNTYTYNKAIKYDKDFNVEEYKRNDENVVLVFGLDKNHIMLVEINSIGGVITEKLIDSIKIIESKKYSSYVVNEKIDNYIISELKRYDNYGKDKITKVNIKIPDKYRAYNDYDDNIYSDRYFGLNYDDEKELYDYEVHYKLSYVDGKIETQVDLINKIFNCTYKCDYLKSSGKSTINNKLFEVYTGGYTEFGGIMFTDINRFYYYINKKVLFYKLESGYLVIEVSGNDKDISDDILREVINFDIEEIKN